MNQIANFAHEHWFWIIVVGIMIAGTGKLKGGSCGGCILGLAALVIAILILVVSLPALKSLIS